MYTLLLALLSFALSSSPAGSGCSPSWAPIAKRQNLLYLYAVATKDTVHLEAGAAQVFLVLQTDSNSSVGLGNKDSTESKRWYFVPWEYNAACEPLKWTGSALWSRPGRSGLFAGVPRQAKDGTSAAVVDVHFAQIQPYDVRGHYGLAPELFLRVWSVVPTLEAMWSDPEQARRTLHEWKRENPSLLQDPGVRRLLSQAADLMEQLDRTRIKH